MAISKLIFDGVTQMDLTGDTVAADKLLQNYTAHGADGEAVAGSLVIPVTYTLLYSGFVYAKNTSTTASSVCVLTLDDSANTKDKILYTKTRAVNTARATGHFVGTDVYLFNYPKANGTTSSGIGMASTGIYINSSNNYARVSSLSGVYASSFATNNGNKLTISAKHNNTSAADIDGIYSIEVYLLDYAPNQGNPFDYSFPANTFSVVDTSNVAKVYSFDSGMTWTQWVASAYNTDSFSISSSKVYKGQSGVYTEAAHTSQVAASATITDGGIYFLN